MRVTYRNRNELTAGPTPEVLASLRRLTTKQLSEYAEAKRSSLLRPALSRKFNITPERIILSYGLEDFLRSLFGHLCPGQDVVLTNDNHYLAYDQIAKTHHIRLRIFSLRRQGNTFVFDVDGCIAAAKRFSPAVIVITTPNNPTGSVLRPNEASRLLRRIPKSTIILFDEAYIGFQRGYDQLFFRRLLDRYPNVGLMRTFSKDYGLAGARLGFVLCGRTLRQRLHDVDRDLGLSRVIEALGITALKDEKYRRRVAVRVQKQRDRFLAAVRRLPSFRVYDSEANFVLLECKSDPIFTLLLKHDRRVRTTIMRAYGRRRVRVTIGRPEDLRKLLKALRTIDVQQRSS